MATKLTAEQLSKAEVVVGAIKTKTEEEARKKLIEFLADNEVMGVEDDSINDLIEMAEVFYEPAPKATPPKKTAKVVQPEPEEEEEEQLEDEDLEEVGEDDEALEEEEEEPVEDDDIEEEPVVKKKATTPAKTAAKPAAKVEVKKAAPVEKSKSAAPAKAAPAKAVRESSGGEKFDGRNVPAHLKYLKPFETVFPKADFEITCLKQGFTVRVLGANAKTTILNFDELKIVDGKLNGNLYTNRFKSVDDLLEVLPDEYHEREIGMFRMEAHPSIRKVTQDEVFDIFNNSELLNVSLDRANAKDAKMGINRERLEETLKQGTKAAPAKSAAKVVAKKK